ESSTSPCASSSAPTTLAGSCRRCALSTSPTTAKTSNSEDRLFLFSTSLDGVRPCPCRCRKHVYGSSKLGARTSGWAGATDARSRSHRMRINPWASAPLASVLLFGGCAGEGSSTTGDTGTLRTAEAGGGCSDGCEKDAVLG